MRLSTIALATYATLFAIPTLLLSPAFAQSKFVEIEFEIPVSFNDIHSDVKSVYPRCGVGVCRPNDPNCWIFVHSRGRPVTLDGNKSASTTSKVSVRADRAFLNSRGWKNGTPLAWECKVEFRTNKGYENPTQDKNAADYLRAASDRPFNVIERGTVTVQ